MARLDVHAIKYNILMFANTDARNLIILKVLRLFGITLIQCQSVPHPHAHTFTNDN